MSYNLTNAAQGGNFTLSKAGGATLNLAIGGAATTITVQNLTYSIKGSLYYKASISSTTPTTDVNTSVAFVGVKANQARCYLFGINAAGTVGVAEGPAVAFTDTTVGSTAVAVPSLPDTYAPFGYTVVQGLSTVVGSWLIGTSNFTGVTGITASTAVDLFSVPATPPVTA